LSGFADERLSQPSAPIAGLPFHVHYGNDPDVIRFVDEDYRVGKVVAEMTARWWIKFPEALGIRCDHLE
jgi:hypothetical protein